MSRQGALAKNTLILSFGSVVPKLVNIVTLPILTGCLSKSEYGTFDLVVSMVTLVLPLATLQLQAAAFRFLIESRDDYERQKTVITNITLVTVGISVLALILVYLLLSGIASTTRVLICTYYLLDIMDVTLRQMARGLSKNLLYAVSVIVNSVSECIAVIGFVLALRFGLNGALLASIIGQATSFVLLLIGMNITCYIDVELLSKSATKELLGYSWPLIPNSLSSWAISMSDRLILTMTLGIEASAIYAAASKIPNMLGIFQTAFSLAWQENASLSKDDRDRDEYYSRMFDTVFSLLSGGLGILIAASPLLFAVLIRGSYEDAFVQMNVLFLGALASCVSSFFGGVYIAHMHTKALGATTAAVAVINLVLEIALIPSLGIFAASMAYTSSYLLLAIYRGIKVQEFQVFNYDTVKIVSSLLALFLMVVLSAQKYSLCYIFNTLISLLLFFKLNFKLIIHMKKSMKARLFN